MPEFRALWLAELLSILGDQLARVALAVLVYGRTSSAMLAALTYALTFAPAVLGGAFLSGLADRFPRRAVLVVTDVVRAVLAALMALPGVPLGVLWTFVALLSMASGPFKAAQLSLLPTVVGKEQYVSAMSLRAASTQVAQLAGFACGGLLLAVVPPAAVLGLNAGTFALSALIVLTGVRARPAVAAQPEEPVSRPDAPVAPFAGVLPIFAMVMLVGLFVVPEGLAAPYGDALGAGPVGVGLLMAADPLGSALGAWLLARRGSTPTWHSMVLLAALAGVPLLFCSAGPALVPSLILWAVTGGLSTAYLIQAQALLVELVPDQRRGLVMGRLATSLYTSQGLAVVLGGALSELTGPFRAVGGAGLLGVVLASCVGVWWGRGRSRAENDRAEPHMTDDDQMPLMRISGTSSRTDTSADGDTRPASPPIGGQGRPLSTSNDGD
ncbi:MFS transporter [Labedaea rhizosphaerae]|uniref:MFS transporter n=1 Tax=Labedaea rhizosphaerae TaxID=598644 RepID=UPI001414FC69|nr:MFS transporter [Labedaea rhizosphaerae]